MNIDNFDTWFESRKIISGKAKEMEELRSLFEECWHNCIDHCEQVDDLKEEINNLENEVSELEMILILSTLKKMIMNMKETN